MSEKPDLITFVRDRLAEREQKTIRTDPMIQWRSYADGVVNLGNGELFVGKANATHIAANDPAYVLRDIAAKRAVLKRHPGATEDSECSGCGAWLSGAWRTPPGEICPELAGLAAVDEAHPDYNPEWRPS